MIAKRLAVATLLLALAPAAGADEGMWTFNAVPVQTLKQRHGFEPTQAWLDHVRLSSVRLAGGCSGSFVSGDGLVMTNHHCAHSCIEQLSAGKRDYIKEGFLAKSPKAEVKCPEIELNQLVAITDVTARMLAATQGKEGKAFAEAKLGELSRIEKECATGEEVRCDVVTLYAGGRYDLYKYRRFQDVRLVFAPELAIAFFGGDPDNFMFPRYNLDVSFLRAYDQGQPARTAEHFSWAPAGAKEGELTFVTGHPGGTSRQLTIAQLEFQRDVALPKRLLYLAELRGLITEYQRRGPEQKRSSTALLFQIENSSKALKGMWEALLEPAFFAQKSAEERAFRARIDADPAKKKELGSAWDELAAAQAQLRPVHDSYVFLEGRRGRSAGFSSDLFGIARGLVRAAEELPKPNEIRLREFTDGALPGLKQGLFSEAPIHPELEIATLGFSLTKLREELGPDDPFVKKVLGRSSPEELARKVVTGSKLADVKLRRKLFDGGKAAVDASKDPMIELARLVDPDARALRRKVEDEIQALESKHGERLARARFETFGLSQYPDATFTLRLSFGTVKGWVENGKEVKPFTTSAGAFERHTGQEPFALPKSWLARKGQLDLATPMNFTTDNDIVGGNSGSPLINARAEVVGLAFDGNLQSLGGAYGFDAAVNRTVAVHSSALTEALSKIYGAQALVDELQGKKR